MKTFYNPRGLDTCTNLDEENVFVIKRNFKDSYISAIQIPDSSGNIKQYINQKLCRKRNYLKLFAIFLLFLITFFCFSIISQSQNKKIQT